MKCRPIRSNLTYDQDIGFYWVRTYEFEYNPDGWKPTILNQGFRELYDSGTKRKPILVNGIPATSESLLDEDGVALAVGADPVYLEFRKYPALPFAVFDFDESDFPGLVW